MSNEIFVAFATQKGGIGKSTVTALAASYPSFFDKKNDKKCFAFFGKKEHIAQFVHRLSRL